MLRYEVTIRINTVFGSDKVITGIITSNVYLDVSGVYDKMFEKHRSKMKLGDTMSFISVNQL